MWWLALLVTPVAHGADLHVHRFSRGYVNVWAIESGDSVVLVDAHYANQSRWLWKQLEKDGIANKIKAIVVTHGHGDHCGGVVAMHEKTGAPVILGAADVDTVTSGHNPPLHPTSALAWVVRTTLPMKFPAFTPDVKVDAPLDLSPYGVTAEVIPMGGHTPGSLIVRLDSGEVFVGDLLRGRMTDLDRPIEHLFQPDVHVVHGLLRSILDDHATILYPGHGRGIPADRVRRWLDRVVPSR
jgi:hydroxyacylglutathione hydrolase